MVKRPNDHSSPLLEEGLRELARGRGPSVRDLQYAITYPAESSNALQVLTSQTATVPDCTDEQRATALWTIIQEEIDKINSEGHHPMCRAALRAAFRLDTEAYHGEEYDFLSARLNRARINGDFGPSAGRDAPRRHWVKGVFLLAHRVETRLNELGFRPEGWGKYGPGEKLAETVTPVPAHAQPVFVNRLVATYVMKGRAVNYVVTERLVTAREHGVDAYIVRAASLVSGSPRVHVRALLNCQAGLLRSLSDGRGGETHEVPMRFPKPLHEGEQCFFASLIVHNEDTNEQPIVEIQVTSHGIAAGGMTMRVQFDEQPVAAWWFGDCIDARRLDKPSEGHPQRLTWSLLGYLDHTFADSCKPMAKYGIAWEWPTPRKSVINAK